MNILSLYVLIPLLMLLALWLARSVNQVRGVMVTGASFLLAMSVWLTVTYLQWRHAGATDEMFLTDSVTWFAPLNICYSVGVDGISVVMLLLSAIIVFTGTFASWRLKPLTKEYFMWFTLLSLGVFGFFISTDLFTMFMFYEVALIPMYLLIGVWGSGRKEYAAMKLTLMLMGGSAFLLIGILGIYYGAGADTMNVIELAQRHIPSQIQHIFFPLIWRCWIAGRFPWIFTPGIPAKARNMSIPSGIIRFARLFCVTGRCTTGIRWSWKSSIRRRPILWAATTSLPFAPSTAGSGAT